MSATLASTKTKIDAMLVELNTALTPVSVALPKITAQTIDRVKPIVGFNDWNESDSSYERMQRHGKYKAAVPAVIQWGIKGSVTGKLIGGVYTLRLYGSDSGVLALTAAATIAPNSTKDGQHTVNVSKLHGYYRMALTCPAPEQCLDYDIYIDGGGPLPKTMPVSTANYDILHGSIPAGAVTSVETSYRAMVPIRYAPAAKPLRPRARAPFPLAATTAQLHARNITGGHNTDNVYLPNVDAGGVPTTRNMQEYHWSTFIRTEPDVNLLDGERGVNRTPMIACILQTERTDPGATDKCYALDGWRLMRITETGRVDTLAGIRFAKPTLYNNGGFELVGDWSGVSGMKGFGGDLWWFRFDPDSFALNASAPSIGNEQPHVMPGVWGLIADPQNNRVLKLQFPADKRVGDPGFVVVVTDWLLGIKDPWGIDISSDANGGEVFISERGSHRIVARNKKTKAVTRTLQGANYSNINPSNRRPVRTGTLAQCQAQPVQLPETIHFVVNPANGHRELWHGSAASLQVRRWDLETNTNPVHATFPEDGHLTYCCFSVCTDGTVGGWGTMGLTTFSNGTPYPPRMYKPDGSFWSTLAPKSTEAGRIEQGRGDGDFDVMSYAMGVSVARGRILLGHAGNGIREYSIETAVDPVVDKPRYRLGKTKFEARGWHLFGPPMGNYYGFNLKGADMDIDYYISVAGA